MSDLSFLREIPVKSLVDDRGVISVAEFDYFEDFTIERIYYISKVPGKKMRGSHAHKSLKQMFFALSGEFSIRVTDGARTDFVKLKADTPGYFLPEGLWRELLNFSEDAICLVLASELFDPEDYIHTFEEYLLWKNSR